MLAGLFTWLWLRAARDRHDLRFLNPLAFLTLAAVAEVAIEGAREVIAPREVARNVDRYLAGLDATGKARIQLGLTALGRVAAADAAAAAAPLDARDAQEFLEKRLSRRSPSGASCSRCGRSSRR